MPPQCKKFTEVSSHSQFSLPQVFSDVNNAYTAVIGGLISLAAAAHQAWGANIFTIVSDVFPKTAVSTVVGISGIGGCIGGILFPLGVGRILEHFRILDHLRSGYNIIFIFCGCLYLFAWSLMYLISPKMRMIPNPSKKLQPICCSRC
jgi:ACS family hexuronate transporter-like MFS transporter